MISDSLKQRFPEGIPESLKDEMNIFEELSKQKHVVKVELLSNFGKDVEMSLTNNTDIYKGLIVETTSEYIPTEKDMSWFHPQLFKTRNLYTSKNAVRMNKIKEGDGAKQISKFNSSAGLYSTHSFDEIGSLQRKDYVIVDTLANSVSQTQVHHWLTSGMKMKDIYTEMTIQKIDGKTLEMHAKDQVESIAGDASTLKSSYAYNRLYKAAGTYLFYNHAVRPQSGKALVHISPLLGYALVDATDKYFESDVMSSDNYLDINSFTDEQRKRAYVKASWAGKNIVNSFALRKPIDNYKSILGLDTATTYRMEEATFSSCPIIEKLSPKVVLQLTPEATAIPEEKAVKLHKHILNNVVKMPATEETLNAILKDNWKSLLSSKYTDGESLFLPRAIVQSL